MDLFAFSFRESKWENVFTQYGGCCWRCRSFGVAIVGVSGIRTHRVLSSQNGPAIRIRIALRGNIGNHTDIPSKTSANRGRTLRLHSNSGDHCNNGNALGTIRGIGAVVTPTLANYYILGRENVSCGVLTLSNATAGDGLKTGTVLNISLTMTRATTGTLGVPLCHCVNNTGACALPIPVVGVVGNNTRSSTPVTFRRFVVHPINTPARHRTVHVNTRIFRTLTGLLGGHKLSATMNSRNNFTPTLSNVRSTLRDVYRTVGSTNCRPNGSIGVTVSYTTSRFTIIRSKRCCCSCHRLGSNGGGSPGNGGLATSRRVTCLRRLVAGCPVSSVRSNLSRGS